MATDPSTVADTIVLLGGPAPYREALTARLMTAGHTVVDGDDASSSIDAGGVAAVVEYVAAHRDWSPVDPGPTGPRRIAVLADLRPAAYVKALAHGNAAVHLDTSTEIMVAVITAALRHETLLPAALARDLGATIASGTTGAAELDRELAELLVAGHTSATIAHRLHFSERTIRRRIQALYLTLGVQTRAEAVERLRSEHDLGA